MFNIRWGIISAAAAFLLVLVIGLFTSDIRISITLGRALIFAVVFFFMGIGIWALINNFLPELLSPGADHDDPVNKLFSAVNERGGRGAMPFDDTQPFGDRGRKVNITLDDSPGAAVPGRNGEAHGIDGVENIANLISGAVGLSVEAKNTADIDQNASNGYTEFTDSNSYTADTGGADGFVPFANGLTGALETDDNDGDFSLSFSSFLPGSTGIPELDSFTSTYLNESDENNDGREGVERKTTGNKPTAFEGDFSPKDIAAGLRTVLEKDKKG